MWSMSFGLRCSAWISILFSFLVHLGCCGLLAWLKVLPFKWVLVLSLHRFLWSADFGLTVPHLPLPWSSLPWFYHLDHSGQRDLPALGFRYSTCFSLSALFMLYPQSRNSKRNSQMVLKYRFLQMSHSLCLCWDCNSLFQDQEAPQKFSQNVRILMIPFCSQFIFVFSSFRNLYQNRPTQSENDMKIHRKQFETIQKLAANDPTIHSVQHNLKVFGVFLVLWYLIGTPHKRRSIKCSRYLFLFLCWRCFFH